MITFSYIDENITLFFIRKSNHTIYLGTYYETSIMAGFVKKIEDLLFLKNLYLVKEDLKEWSSISKNRAISTKFHYNSKTLLDFIEVCEILVKQDKGKMIFKKKGADIITKDEFIKLVLK